MNLNQLTVPVLSVEQAILFYQRLGLHLIVHTHAAYARFECPDGHTTLSLHQVADLPVGDGIWLYFECESVDETVSELQQKGIVFDSLPTDQPWLWREAHLKDPDNNHLVLYHAGTNRLHPPWRIR
jgi:catechol 2,3-dioxygenase-like lactoylglutathione lyase family enzyme